MRILFLDDSEERHRAYRGWSIGHVVEHVHTARQAIAALKGERFDLVSLDHDLCKQSSMGGTPTEATGMEVAEYIAAMPPGRRPRAVSIHSLNPSAAPRMLAVIDALEDVRAMRAPFSGPTVSAVLRWTAKRLNA